MRKKVDLFLRDNSITRVNYKNVKEVVCKSGYTVIEFNSICNDEDTEVIIENLKLKEAVKRSRGFTYADENYRLVFINEDLNEKEKLMVMAHEAGHIVLGHIPSAVIIGYDVQQEHEANEFAHYLLNKQERKKKNIFKIVALIIVTIIAGVTAYVALSGEKPEFTEYYVTETGNKYHLKDCGYIGGKTSVRKLTKDEFESNLFEPCSMCVSDKND